MLRLGRHDVPDGAFVLMAIVNRTPDSFYDRGVRAGTIVDGDLVLVLAAGTGYTWAASVVRWGSTNGGGR